MAQWSEAVHQAEGYAQAVEKHRIAMRGALTKIALCSHAALNSRRVRSRMERVGWLLVPHPGEGSLDCMEIVMSGFMSGVMSDFLMVRHLIRRIPRVALACRHQMLYKLSVYLLCMIAVQPRRLRAIASRGRILLPIQDARLLSLLWSLGACMYRFWVRPKLPWLQIIG